MFLLVIWYLWWLIVITAIIWSALKKLRCYVDHFVFCIKVMCLFWPGRYFVISIPSESSIHFFYKLCFRFCSHCCWIYFLHFANSEDFDWVSLWPLLLQKTWRSIYHTARLAEINCALSCWEMCQCCTLLVTTYFVFLMVDRSSDEPMVWTAGTAMHLSFYMGSKHVFYFKLGCPVGQPPMWS